MEKTWFNLPNSSNLHKPFYLFFINLINYMVLLCGAFGNDINGHSFSIGTQDPILILEGVLNQMYSKIIVVTLPNWLNGSGLTCKRLNTVSAPNPAYKHLISTSSLLVLFCMVQR